MPCCSEHMNPSGREIESKKVITYLVEVGLYKGTIGYYGDVRELDNHTSQLCEFCQGNDITESSFELQIWWRDHQQADRDRLAREQQEAKTVEEKEEALSKLTDYEKELLNL